MSSEPCEIAILFADVAGSTRLYESLGDSAAHARVEACLDLVTAAVLEAGGTIVKRIGCAGGLRLRRRRAKESGGAPSVSAQGRAALHPRRFPVRACAEGWRRLLRRDRERGGAHGRRRHRASDHHDRAVRRTAAVSTTVDAAQPWPGADQGKGGRDRRGRSSVGCRTCRQRNALAEGPARRERGEMQGPGPGPPRAQVAVRRIRADRFARASPDLRPCHRGPARLAQPGGDRAPQSELVIVDHSTNGTHVVFASGDDVHLHHSELILHGKGHLAFGTSDDAAEPEVVKFSLKNRPAITG
jgi:adenylate cyclase